MKKLVRLLFAQFGLYVGKLNRVEFLFEVEARNSRLLEDLQKAEERLQTASNQKDAAEQAIIQEFRDFLDSALKNLGAAPSEFQSQIGQDLIALILSGCRREGFFVEVGAASGVDLSNTFVLEKQFGWNGILVEPAEIWHESLRLNRNCTIDHRCVWSSSGDEIDFLTTEKAELSTISRFQTADIHAERRSSAIRSRVKTVSLLDLLKEHGAPQKIDYMSIDTEGSELEIISAFDFSRYLINFITIEHNFGPQRDAIKSLMNRNGYQRILSRLSAWDDWYVYVGKKF